MRFRFVTWMGAVWLFGGVAYAQEDRAAAMARLVKMRAEVNEVIESYRTFGQAARAWRGAMNAKKAGLLEEIPNLDLASRTFDGSAFGQGRTAAQKDAAYVQALSSLRSDLRALREYDIYFRSHWERWRAAIERWHGGAFLPALRAAAVAQMAFDERAEPDAFDGQMQQMQAALESVVRSRDTIDGLFGAWKRAIDDWQGAQFLPSRFGIRSFSTNRGAQDAAH